jgi:uncharacterized protein YjbJ (UPF0337 family)
MTANPTSGASSSDQRAKAAIDRETRGSVTEAIGKLIGDDAARDRGTAEKHAVADTRGARKKSTDT